MTNEAEAAIRALQGASENAEEALWRAVVACQGLPFRTATGLPFTYCLKIGQNGQPNRELLIDRREKSKTLSWSSVCLAFRRAREIGYADRPKALGAWGMKDGRLTLKIFEPEMVEEDTLTVEKTERGVHVQMRITTTGDENVFFDQTIS